jgi:hypothetical protein
LLYKSTNTELLRNRWSFYFALLVQSTNTDADAARADAQQVVALLALLVQKYKY